MKGSGSKVHAHGTSNAMDLAPQGVRGLHQQRREPIQEHLVLHDAPQEGGPQHCPRERRSQHIGHVQDPHTLRANRALRPIPFSQSRSSKVHGETLPPDLHNPVRNPSFQKVRLPDELGHEAVLGTAVKLEGSSLLLIRPSRMTTTRSEMLMASD